MKVNHYAIIPSQVRYDRALSSTSVLLFGEISAATNVYGICDEDNDYFSAALRIDVRTVTRCISQLVEQGHIQKIKEDGKRKLRIVTKGLELPPDLEIETIASIPVEDISQFVNQIFHIWETKLETKIDKKELYTEIIRARLAAFSKDDVIVAVQNRIQFVSESSWHNLPENRQSAVDIEQVIADDKKMLKWLNAKPETTQPKLKAFKYN